jgi:AcrR family transcriptional regulator
MPRPYKPSTERREALLQSAAKLIAQYGLNATTMPDIAAYAGLSVGGLYRHFKSKADLVNALIEIDGELLCQSVREAVQGQETAEALRLWATSQLSGQEVEDSFVLRLEILALAARQASIASVAIAHEAKLNDLAHSLLIAAPKNSLAASSPDLANELLACLVDGLAVRAAVAGGLSSHAETLVAHTVHFLLQPMKSK